ncbi:MAG: hypothetical protein NTX96_00325 [Candidatus Zambryskibacteria bacterium]|nr:hypothetical protein [Candidatus Zambryskibacteria bacterium]
MTCYISDGYSNVDWIRKCAEALDKNKDVSLIWGIPWSIDRNSHMINARFTEFDYTEQPQREELFYCWMKTGLSAVETNLCVRKEVLLECYPTLKECEKDILDWQEFTFRFNSRGYLALHIPVIANYSHIDHEGKYMMRLKKSGKYKRQLDTYNLNMSNYIKSLVLGSHIHKFIDSHGNILPIKFDRKRVIVDYIKNKIKKNKKYIQPSKYVAYVKKLW